MPNKIRPVLCSGDSYYIGGNVNQVIKSLAERYGAILPPRKGMVTWKWTVEAFKAVKKITFLDLNLWIYRESKRIPEKKSRFQEIGKWARVSRRIPRKRGGGAFHDGFTAVPEGVVAARPGRDGDRRRIPAPNAVAQIVGDFEMQLNQAQVRGAARDIAQRAAQVAAPRFEWIAPMPAPPSDREWGFLDEVPDDIR